MSAIATERWSDRRPVRTAKGRVYERGWDIINAATEDEALDAIGVSLDDPHPAYALALAEEVSATSTGPLSWRGNARYSIPPDGATHGNPDDDPLDKPMVISWDDGYASEPTDMDADGVVMLNSAKDPFETQATQEIPLWFFSLSKNYLFFDPDLAAYYRNTINSDIAVLFGLTIQPGRLRCISIKPTHDYTEDATFVTVRKSFEVRAGRRLDADGMWDGFKHRLLDQGYNGWYNSGGLKRGPIYHFTTTEPINTPALLDGTGKPIDTNFVIGEAGEAPVAAQTLLPQYLESTGSAHYLKYPKYRKVPYAGIMNG